MVVLTHRSDGEMSWKASVWNTDEMRRQY